MQGHPEVIDYLNTLLTGELAARDQYFIHSRMYEDWGFSKLYERLNHEMEEDPACRRPAAPYPPARRYAAHASRRYPPGHHGAGDARGRPQARAPCPRRAGQGHRLCEQHKDFVSRDILKAQLADTEEDHAYWLEQQLGLIARMGLENYLQSQI